MNRGLYFDFVAHKLIFVHYVDGIYGNFSQPGRKPGQKLFSQARPGVAPPLSNTDAWSNSAEWRKAGNSAAVTTRRKHELYWTQSECEQLQIRAHVLQHQMLTSLRFDKIAVPSVMLMYTYLFLGFVVPHGNFNDWFYHKYKLYAFPSEVCGSPNSESAESADSDQWSTTSSVSGVRYIGSAVI